MRDIEQKARAALAALRGPCLVWEASAEHSNIAAALDELRAANEDSANLAAALSAARDNHATDLCVLQTEVDILKADLADARRERDEARAEVLKAQEAMDNGADDSRWIPGTTAVDSLIRERDDWRKRYETLEVERATCCAKMQLERDEAVRQLTETQIAYDELEDGTSNDRLQLTEAVRLLREWEGDTGRFTSLDEERKRMPSLHARRDAFLSKFPERPIDQTAEGVTPHVSDTVRAETRREQILREWGGLDELPGSSFLAAEEPSAEPAKESEPRCTKCGGTGFIGGEFGRDTRCPCNGGEP